MKLLKVDVYREVVWVDSTTGSPWRDPQDGGYRWRLTHWNGNVLTVSSEAYVRRIDAVKILRLLWGDRLVLDAKPRGDLSGTVEPAFATGGFVRSGSLDLP